ncbi:MAG: glycosyl hydrolase [bacterium]|nr:glycosyl hydrolase [bacterium]
MKSPALFLSIVLFGFGLNQSLAQKKDPSKSTASPLATPGLQFRLLGPALTSGRVIDLAVHPNDANTWFVAAASGGVWRTQNHGTTFEPIFDQYGSYSIGCLSIAKSNSNTLWVGTGENNNQRSVAYGDGVYKSVDGGKSFQNMGLKSSEHIGKIIIHPQDEQTVWVAAYGGVWSAGGERGVYKTTDGGKTWERTLFISDETGVAEIAIDPTNPNILYASAHQRRRHEWTYIGGGPESALYKSMDGGKTWNEINNGLPKNEMGRIGLAVSPVDANYVYAIVEARADKGGIYRSCDKGMSFSKMSGYSTSGNYYQEIMCDPKDRDKVFVMDTWLHHSSDGGKTVEATGEELKHVDNHCIWIDPNNTNHWLVGCDGGLYETYNHAKEWRYFDNLPITQFYKVASDNATPFYHVYGGTQDNNSMGGPSATRNNDGIANSDWFITWGGDGFESAIDPTNHNIAYSQSQYGGLVRYNKLNGEKLYIQPLPAKGMPAYRWNWDAPLLISPHQSNTLYFAANKLFKSSNQGNDWQVISPDLTQQIDRNKLKVMDRVWSVDAIMKNQSTTIYGNIIALDESPRKPGLLYVGNDDGLIQVSENDGGTWNKITGIAGIPPNTRVNMITASLHNENEVYACFVNQRAGDFKPYLFKSSDKGKTWNSLVANLPARGSVYCIKQDHVDANLLFAGTEFGAYYSKDGGKNWDKLSGLPTIAVYDLEIQKRESDLIAATFGRGFYVLDNYAPLRNLEAQTLSKKAHIFAVKDALLYVPSSSNGMAGTGSQGHSFWMANNPCFGANFYVYLKDEIKGLKATRTQKELNDEKEKKDVFYPTWEQLRVEAQEEDAQLVCVIKNAADLEVKKITAKPSVGIQKITWNLRTESTMPLNPNKPKPGRYDMVDDGHLVTAGTYTLTIYLVMNGIAELLLDPTSFVVKDLDVREHKNLDRDLLSFRIDVANLNRSISGSARMLNEYQEKCDLMKFAVRNYPNVPLALLQEIRKAKLALDSCSMLLYGDGILLSREVETPPTFYHRLSNIQGQLFESSAAVGQTQKDNFEWANGEYEAYRILLNATILQVKALEEKLDQAKVPYLKGKDEKWKRE